MIVSIHTRTLEFVQGIFQEGGTCPVLRRWKLAYQKSGEPPLPPVAKLALPTAPFFYLLLPV